MEKHEFTAQHARLKWLCALPLLAAALIIQYFIRQYIEDNLRYYVCCAFIMAALLTVYYVVTDKLRLFRFKGSYGQQDGKIILELGKKTYEIGEVTSLMNGTPRIFLSRYAYLWIETPAEKIAVAGEDLHGEQMFSDSGLQPLFQLILDTHKELQPKTVMGTETDGWYVKPEDSTKS